MSDNWIGRILITNEDHILDKYNKRVKSLYPCDKAGLVVDTGLYPKLHAKLMLLPPTKYESALEQTIKPLTGGINYFGGDGESTWLSPDGTTMVTSAHFKELALNDFQGAVYTYSRSGASFTNDAIITPVSLGLTYAANARLGLAVVGCEDRMIVSAGTDTAAFDKGVVYVMSTTGTLIQTLYYGLSVDSQYGSHLTLSEDGSTLLVSSHPDDIVAESAEVYLYKWNGAAYVLTDTLVSSSLSMERHLTTAVSSDGSVIVLTTVGTDTIQVYEWNTTTNDYEQTNVQQPQVVLGSVISEDGNLLVSFAANEYITQRKTTIGWEFEVNGVPVTDIRTLSLAGKFLAIGTLDAVHVHAMDAQGVWNTNTVLGAPINGTLYGYPEVTKIGELAIPASRVGTADGAVYMYLRTDTYMPKLPSIPEIVGKYKVVTDTDPRYYVDNSDTGGADYAIVPRPQTIEIVTTEFTNDPLETDTGGADYAIVPRVQTLEINTQEYTAVPATADMGGADYAIVPRVQTITLVIGI